MPTPVPRISSRPLSGGGFFAPSDDPSSSSYRSLSGDPATIEAGHDVLEDDAAPVRLGPTQLTRLRSHLDERMMSIRRRYNKRHHRADSTLDAQGSSSRQEGEVLQPLDSLERYVSAWIDEVLPIVARIDPVGAQQSTTVTAYAMAVTDELTQGLPGYPLLDDRPEVAASMTLEQAHKALSALFTLLNLIDALWSALLVGRRLHFARAQLRAKALANFEDASSSSPTSQTAQNKKVKDTQSLQGSVGMRTLTMTDQIRLKNLLVERRDEVTRWILESVGVQVKRKLEKETKSTKTQASSRANNGSSVIFPQPSKRKISPLPSTTPESASAKRRKGRRSRKTRFDLDDAALFTEQGDIDRDLPKDGIVVKDEVDDRGADEQISQVSEDEDEDEEDLEEVEVPASGQQSDSSNALQQAGQGPASVAEEEPETAEHAHYRALFERKIDPDADDDDDHDDSNDGSGADQSQRDEGASHDGLAGEDEQLTAETKDSDQGDGPLRAPLLPLDPLQLQALTSRIFKRTLVALERLASTGGE